MADTVTTRTLYSAPDRVVVQATGLSDGTGESFAIKIDRSALTGPTGAVPTRVAIEEVQWSTSGYNYVKMAWSNTTNVTIDMLAGDGYRNYTGFGRSRESDSEVANRTALTGGDVIFSTPAGSSNAVYDVVISARLEP